LQSIVDSIATQNRVSILPTAGGIFGPQVETGVGYRIAVSTDWWRFVSVKIHGLIQPKLRPKLVRQTQSGNLSLGQKHNSKTKQNTSQNIMVFLN
jgi:hypothetical protein